MHSFSGTVGSRHDPRWIASVPRAESGRGYRLARRAVGLLVCVGAFFAAGCHSNNNASGYGIAWVTLTDNPGDFSTYTVNVDSITLTRSDTAVVTALATVETVDFTKLSSVAELWGTATIPIGTYTSASIVLDYTSAVIGVIGPNGLPVLATVKDPSGNTGTSLATVTIQVNFDPDHPLVIVPTYATTAAQRLALDFNLAASSTIDTTTSPATVTIRPYLTAAIAAPDNKLIRVRGPLINTSVDLGTYSVYVRPFYDEVDSLGALTLFGGPQTIYTINGSVYTGSAGINQLSQSSVGSSVTVGYAAYVPTATPSATAADFDVKYVVAGSTLEDIYTQGVEGDVVARSGNTLTVRGATLQLNDGTSQYFVADTAVVLGPNTLVTADDNSTLTGLNYNSVAVGQHIIARGLAAEPTATTLTLDATGSTATNTGSVRLISTPLWGSVVSTTGDSVNLNLSTISNWPVSDFNFAGNGSSAAAEPTAADFMVSTGTIALPVTAVGTPLWINGIVAPFGSAPPDFKATTVNDELSVQMVGAVAPSVTCGQVAATGTVVTNYPNQDCIPASMRVTWNAPGTTTPFNGLTTTPTVNLTGVSSAVIRIGSESIDMTKLAASPQIIATAAPPVVTQTASGQGSTPQTLPPVFLPDYSFGNPFAVAPLGINVYSAFSTFASNLATAVAATPALQLEARGTYNSASNTFTAISVSVVL